MSPLPRDVMSSLSRWNPSTMTISRVRPHTTVCYKQLLEILSLVF